LYSYTSRAKIKHFLNLLSIKKESSMLLNSFFIRNKSVLLRQKLDSVQKQNADVVSAAKKSIEANEILREQYNHSKYELDKMRRATFKNFKKSDSWNKKRNANWNKNRNKSWNKNRNKS